MITFLQKIAAPQIRACKAEKVLLANLAPRNRRIRAVVPTALLVLMAMFLVDSAFRRSPVGDEPDHLVRGLSYWWTGSARLSCAHPPAGNAVVALPGAFLFPKDDFSAYAEWQSSDQKRIRSIYFRRNYLKSGHAQLMSARLTTAALTILMGLYIFLLCRRHWGWWTGVAALGLLVFNPTLLAYGRFVLTDLPVTFGLILLLGEFVNYLQKRGVVAVFRLTGAICAALLTKYSAIPITIVVLLSGVLFAIKGTGRFHHARLRRRVGLYVGQMAAVSIAVIVCMNAVYRFDRSFLTVEEILNEPEPQEPSVRRHENGFLEQTPLSSLPRGFRVPLPYTYVFGVMLVWNHAQRGHRSWFMGKRDRFGNPLYFPVLLLVKTPIAYWIFLMIGLAAFIFRPRRPSMFATVIGGGFVLFMAMIIQAKINIGIRHALPAVPLLSMLAARGIVRGSIVLSAARIGRIKRAILCGSTGISLACLPIGLFVNYPDFSGYFNVSVGRSAGHRISILGEDSGQDTIQFAEYLKHKKRQPLYYNPLGIGEMSELKRTGVEYRGFDCRKMHSNGLDHPAYIAMHAVSYHRGGRKCLPRKGSLREIARINDHILLFQYKPPKKKKRTPLHSGQESARSKTRN